MYIYDRKDASWDISHTKLIAHTFYVDNFFRLKDGQGGTRIEKDPKEEMC